MLQKEEEIRMSKEYSDKCTLVKDEVNGWLRITGELQQKIAYDFGYKDELKNCFFNYNKGLDSRFTWRFKTDEYTSAELKLIFIKKINEINWSIKKEVKTKWFEEKKNYFKYFGRDMETLLAKVKIAHGRRVFCLAEKEKKLISLKDMNKGFNLFLENDEVKSRTDKNIIGHMYV